MILGLENQSKIHYAMPLRHMIGDAFSYLKEYKELEAKNKKYKNYKTKHEFLSKFQKTDRLHPIVTICIYYGEDSLKLEQEGVELNMCKALEELEERGREKGRIEGRREGRREGEIKGEIKNKILLIQKKSQRGDSMEKIIDDLMESIEFVQPIYEMIKQNPELSVDEIYGIINK